MNASVKKRGRSLPILTRYLLGFERVGGHFAKLLAAVVNVAGRMDEFDQFSSFTYIAQKIKQVRYDNPSNPVVFYGFCNYRS